MREKKRLSINIFAQFIAFAIQFGINFFLTPFVVDKLGADAYGFIGLASSFVMYAQIITIALNSMAGRFIAIEYHKGNVENANKYYTSVFYANVFLSAVLIFISIICCCFLQYLINIPDELIEDVKGLFMLLMVNFLVSIVFSIFEVVTFIKNRLDLVAVRSITSNIIRGIIIVFAFRFFAPHLWYVGLASIICTLYISYINYQYKLKLTPNLDVEKKNFEFSKIVTIVNSGVWNTVARLANLLSQGFDLLFANLFIGATAMGYFSITKHFPVIVVSLVNSICITFAPSLTRLYAKGERDEIKKELIFSMKITSVLSTIPLCFLFGFCDIFYKLWLPNQNSMDLYILTVIGISYLPINLALEGIQNIWPVLDKVKGYSLFSISFSVLTLLTLFGGICFIPSDYKLYFLAGVSAFWNFVKFGVFVPLYASKCLQLKWNFFYKDIANALLATILIVVILQGIREMATINSWLVFFVMLFIEIIICLIVDNFIIFSKNDRGKIINMIKSKVR